MDQNHWIDINVQVKPLLIDSKPLRNKDYEGQAITFVSYVQPERLNIEATRNSRCNSPNYMVTYRNTRNGYSLKEEKIVKIVA